MKAVVCRGFEDASVEEVPRPEPESHEVLISVKRVQLSITECWLYEGRRVTGVFEVIRDRIENEDGRVFGHEFAGIVAEAGEDVDDLAVGDRVYAPGHMSCGHCPYCDRGHPEFCENKETTGFHYPGALAEYLTVPEEPLAKLPDGVSDAEGAALQPLRSALFSVQEADIETGALVGVIGCGVMGYQCGQLARQQGADRVVAIDVDPARLDLAAEQGMIPVDPSAEDPETRVTGLVDGTGADVVFEAVGGDQTHATDGDDPLAEAFRIVRKGGRIVSVGSLTSDALRWNPQLASSKAVRWINPSHGHRPLSFRKNTGEYLGRLVASDTVSIAENITHEVFGLESFEEAIAITLDKATYDARGPAQIVLDE